LLIKTERAKAIIAPYLQRQQWRGSLAWHFLQLQHKRVEIYPSSRGLFLPHRLDLHISGYIDFNKGCYKGQEIIARTHYRAKLKHTLALFTVHTAEPLRAGQVVRGMENQNNIGELIDHAPLGNDLWLVALSIQHDAPGLVQFEHHLHPVELSPFKKMFF